MIKQNTKHFPEYKKSFWDSIGPAVILIGLGIGSGEFILWPYLSTNYGFGILWGALLGITLQLFIVLEVQRYTVVRGENIIKGFSRIWKFLPVWVIVSTLIGFGWPGFAAISAKLAIEGFSLSPNWFLPLAVIVLIVSAGVLLIGKNVYEKVAFSQKINIPALFLLIIFLFIYYFDLSEFLDLLKGFVGIGDTYWFLPTSISIGVFLGALAYAGSGGNLLLSNSFYAIEEGQGLTKKESKFILWQKNAKNAKEIDEENFPDKTTESLDNFRKLRKLQILRNFFIFWGLGLLTIILLAYLSKVVLIGKDISNDFSFLVVEAGVFKADIGWFVGAAFLILGIYNLASVQMGIFDFMGRSTAYALKELPLKNKLDHNKVYVGAILVQLLFGILIFFLGFTQPKSLIILSSVINAFVMALIAIFLIILNFKHIPKEYSANKIQIAVLFIATIIYLLLFSFTIYRFVFV